jgi:DNA-binding transcriptional regulator YiaG
LQFLKMPLQVNEFDLAKLAERLISIGFSLKQGRSLAMPLPRLHARQARLESAFAKTFYVDTQVRGILKALCDKHGGETDDLSQEVLSVLLKGFANQKISLASAPLLYSYLYRVAEVLAFKAYHHTKSAHTDSLNTHNEGGIHLNNEAYFKHSDEGHQILNLEDRLDAARHYARARIENKRLNKTLTQTIAARTVKPVAMPPSARPAPGATLPSLQRLGGTPPRSKDQQTLYEAWQKSMLSQKAFATELGTNTAKLQSYFAARTLTVPAEIMAALTFFESRHQASISQLASLFGDAVPMVHIISRWLAQLKTPGSNVLASKAYLALVLSVHRSTLSRWESGELRPNVASLAGYERRVQHSAASSNKHLRLSSSVAVVQQDVSHCP